MECELKTLEDIEDFVKGVTFFGTGGGGRAEIGVECLKNCLKDGYDIKWEKNIPDETWCCTVFGMGSIAPVRNSKSPYGLKEKTVMYPMAKAVEKLGEHEGVNIEALLPFELGGSNTPKVMEAAIRLGIMIIDGDFCGRAVPEMGQTTVAIEGADTGTIVICDDWGNHIVVEDAANIECAEGIGKMMSIITKSGDPKAICANAAFLMKGEDLKKYIVPGTLSKSLAVGKAIRKASISSNPKKEIEKAADGKFIFEGVTTDVDWESKDGYMIGNTFIKNSNGDLMRIWYKNENHLAEINGQAIVTSPDLIVTVELPSCIPITNTNMRAGLNVGVIVIPNVRFRTEQGIKALGPQHFKLSLDYVPC